MAKSNLSGSSGTWASGLEAQSEKGYRMLAYSGSLGGGTLRVYTTVDGVETPVPDSKLHATKLDDNDDVIQQLIFATAGVITVKLTGASGANVDLVLA